MTRTERLGKASVRILTIALMAMGLAVGASALATTSQPAYAYTPKAGGQPGEIQVPVTQGAYQVEAVITFPARYVWRSNAYADTQVITVTYTMWKYSAASGTWQLYNSRVRSAQVALNGIGAWFTAWTTPVPFDSFAVNVQVNWATLDGTVFGWKVIDYNTATDYQCLTATTCSVLPNASVGAFIYLHPVAQPAQAPTQATTEASGGSSVTIPGGIDPTYEALFGGAAGPNDPRCIRTCRLYNDYDVLLGQIRNNGTDINSQINQTGAVIAALQNAANNYAYGRITLQ